MCCSTNKSATAETHRVGNWWQLEPIVTWAANMQIRDWYIQNFIKQQEWVDPSVYLRHLAKAFHATEVVAPTWLEGFGSSPRWNMVFTMWNYVKPFMYAYLYCQDPHSRKRPVSCVAPSKTAVQTLLASRASGHLLSESTLDASKARMTL